jgi:SAM-dependent methyltransferase
VHAQSQLLFRSAIFLASFLLFVSEPIAAKQLLPTFGGSAAVWMTCLVFFQVALLAGYLYAHEITRGPATRRQTILHIALLALATLSAAAWALGAVHPKLSDTSPVSGIFATLALSIGLPFLLLGSTSPLLQVWHFRLEQTAIPFRLFALSNFASLLALLSYPTLIEPYLTLQQQRSLWAAGVTIFALITATLAWQTSKAGISSSQLIAQSSQLQDPSLPLSPRRAKLLWFLLPMAAAMQLSAVTAHLTSNIAAIPLLWVLPLAVYLLTFILAFQLPNIRKYRGILLRLLAVMLASLGYLLVHTDVDVRIEIAIVFFLVEAFVACLFFHSETYALRPQRASETTLFYLVIAAGGATGSFLIGIAAPLVFSGNYDLALTFLITAVLALVVVWDTDWMQRALWITGAGLLVFLVFALHSSYHRQALLTRRNFYGSLRVQQTVTTHGDPIRSLMNGTIEHGSQIDSPDLSRVPTTYYAEDSGIGLALKHCCEGRPKRVGVVGLGVGTLAAYGKPGDTFRFYEINPSVLPIAQNLFTYLRESKASLTFIEGDGRASLAAEPSQQFDVLVVDAFSGDAIPLHLLTVEALAIYRRHLAPGGILAFHVSNQYVDLESEVAQLAASANLQVCSINSPPDDQSGEFRAIWGLVTDNTALFDEPDVALRATEIKPVPHVSAWTDNYSSLLPLVRW